MAWSELHLELRQQIYDMLVERKWELLPVDTDRTKLPGFLIALADRRDLRCAGCGLSAKYPGCEGS